MMRTIWTMKTNEGDDYDEEVAWRLVSYHHEGNVDENLNSRHHDGHDVDHEEDGDDDDDDEESLVECWNVGDLVQPLRQPPALKSSTMNQSASPH